ncbi:MAG: response regulator [Rhodospirillaceae bacterium]|nr:response regulator [Rhodospirillaceae bacterium]MBT5459623.1 response regulator [Rhodospirillaceae bacterium]
MSGLLATGGQTASAANHSRILFIASYSPSFHSFFKQIDGLKAGLAEAGHQENKYVLDIEFLDSKRFPLGLREQELHQTLVYKLNQLPRYDVVVTADDNALNFAKSRQDTLLEGSPIVFLGVNNRNLASAQNANPNIVGVVEQTSLGDTLSLAAQLFNRYGPVQVIHDDTPTGRINRRQLNNVLKARPDLAVNQLSLSELTYDELLGRLASLPASTPIFLNSVHRDAYGQNLDIRDFMARLRKVFSGPVFTVQRDAIGKGALGGKIVSHFEQGRAAAGLASKLMHGVASETLRVVMRSPNVYMFDYAELNRLGINHSMLPPDSQIIGAPQSTVEKYIYWISGAAVLIALQTAFIVLLTLNTRRRRHAEISLRESDARFRAFFDNSPSMMYVKDRQHRLTFVNAQYLALYGAEASEVIGQRGGSKLTTAQRTKVEENDRRVMDQEITVNDTVPILLSSGKTRQFYMTKFPVYGANGDVTGIGGINTDVNELHEREQELREAKATAEKAAYEADAANRSKSTFLATMSHEIRTPMNGVLGTADLLAHTALSEDQRELVDMMKESGKSLLDLLNDILDLSKIEAGGVELEERDFYIEELIKATNNLWAQPARDKGLDFSIHNQISDCKAILSDRNRLRQILNNLIGNAIKFTSEGRVEITASDTLVDDETVQLRFEIRDTGIGISEDHMEKIFEPFTQADSSTTRTFGGTGLGLTICKNLAEMLGGDIGIESTLGEGSNFWFTITAKRAMAGQPRNNGPTPSPSQSAVRNDRPLHILVAEDNELNQRIISWMLTPLNCQFDIVGDGLEAVAAVARSRYDVVLMDVQMPGMDGITATRKIRAVDGPHKDIPIIALTANAMQGDAENYLKAGMTDYVSKPIDQRKLLETITRLADITMPEFDEAALSAEMDAGGSGNTGKSDAEEEIKDLMGDLDDLLDGTGR